MPTGGPNPPWAQVVFDNGATVSWSEPGDKSKYPHRTVTVTAVNGVIVTIDQETGEVEK